jgi:hypothetical protein
VNIRISNHLLVIGGLCVSLATDSSACSAEKTSSSDDSIGNIGNTNTLDATGGSLSSTGGQAGANVGSGGVANLGGSPGSGGTASVAEADGGSCGRVTEKSKNTRTPVDVIIGIDTSGSTSQYVQMTQDNLNAFAQQITKANVDVHIIIVASTKTGRVPYYDVDGPCIAPPLGSGNCPDDSNPPKYVHLDVYVDSFGVLDAYINQYPNYKKYLRNNSVKTFVSITDDNADPSSNPLAVAAGYPAPAYHTADAFIDAVNKLEPKVSTLDVHTTPMWSDWRYSAIFTIEMCPTSSYGSVGAVHAELVERTKGVAGDICKQDFKPVFDTLANNLVSGTRLACEWVIPKPPNGEELDINNTAVQFTVNGKKEPPLPKVQNEASCKDHEAWYYDKPTVPTRVLACPAMCERVQAAREAEVAILFDCASPVIE